MNDLGILLAWSAVQATMLALAAAAISLLAARRRPAVGAAVAAAGLGGAVILPLLALCPLPAWWGWRAPEAAAPAAPAVEQASAPLPAAPDDADTPPASLGGPAWPISLMHRTWNVTGQAVAPFRDHSESGWGIAAIVLLSGAGLCLTRLGAGLWAVGDLRRRSRPIQDDTLCRLLRQMREEMGCRGLVELRESPGLGAPAAAGWLRPVVLLPEDWGDWTEPELRTTLAHELAHVRRSDYLFGLLARLGLALHFYHPLLYWLGGRLRQQQELAADALAAPFAGGRDAYLLGLARLALRLSDRRPAGWPANPLFSRGMLIRRIRMLNAKDGGFTRPTPRWSRALVAAVMAAAAVGASALRCPAQKADDVKPPPVRPAAAGVSPDVNGFKTGGDFMLLNSLEYQAPLVTKDAIYPVAFVDSGTVEQSAEIKDYRVSAGFGLRIVAPLLGQAPIALDFGFPIVKGPQDNTQVFSFWLGFFR
jgi:beta-lactamase regulating signal transducer with metallopeptidase domain